MLSWDVWVCAKQDVKDLQKSVAALQARLQETRMERISLENAHKMALVEVRSCLRC